MFLPAMFFFILLLNQSFILNKQKIGFKIAALLAFIISLFILTQIPKFNFLISTFLHLNQPIAWIHLTVFYGFYQSVIPNFPPILFYAFLIGIAFLAFDLFIWCPKLKNMKANDEDLEIKSDAFNLLLILSILVSFIFLLRHPSFEYRWFFPFLLGMLVFTSKGIIQVSEYTGKLFKNKNIIIILIILILALGMYNQIIHADGIIKMKVDSYSQVRDSGLWMKENSDKSEIIISASVTQHTFYSERKIEDFYVNSSNENESAFNSKIRRLNPKYMVLSAFEPGFTPSWAYDWPQRHNNDVTPVKGYYLDAQQQPALVVYEFNNYSA